MRDRNREIYVADFETLATQGVTETWVWGGAIVRQHPAPYTIDEVVYFDSIDSFFSIIEEILEQTNAMVYFHNLKFDGAFIIDYLLRNNKWTHAVLGDVFIDDKQMKNRQFKYLISDKGSWYTIRIKDKGHFCTFTDSLKLIPLSVQAMGKAFDTEHRKTTMSYNDYREAGYVPTKEELEYIKNDVLVVAEALTKMIENGHEKTTIGSCCIDEYKRITRTENRLNWKTYFPMMKDIQIDPEVYGCDTAEKYIRASYRGGWCYLKKGCEDIVYHNGCTYDYNSMYPSMMHGDSGNIYPVGKPVFWSGNYIPEEARQPLKYYFVRFKGCFQVKKGFLPTVQIKTSPFYRANEMLESSDISYKGKRIKEYEKDGKTVKHTVTLTMTCTDFDLFRDHYDYEIEILDGCYFDGIRGLFDFYINKYAKIKMETKDLGMRTISKLFLNNLYGQEAKSDDSSYKICRLNEQGLVKFHSVVEHNKKPVYIPIGSAITAYARNTVIRAAQNNYDDFIYADTDSIHCKCPASEIKGIPIHKTKLQHWDCEVEWETGFFHRQKTYIEITENEMIIKAAGMPDKSKKYFEDGIKTGKYTLSDFKSGLTLPGNLEPKRIKGGIILEETTYTMQD